MLDIRTKFLQDRGSTERPPKMVATQLVDVHSPTAAEPEWRDTHLRRAIKAAGIAMWSWNVDTDHLTMDESAFDLWGVEQSDKVTFTDLSAHIHPEDRDRVQAAFSATRALLGAYETDFRIVTEKGLRWVSARGQGNDADIEERIMFGIFLDVTGRKQAEESNELLAGEMSHRVKNLLTIATSLTNFSAMSAETPKAMAVELTNRLIALGRAHDLARPIPNEEGQSVLLADLITVLLAPYDDLGAFRGRVRVSVPRMGIGETSTTVLALAIHELATNSLKYGALSVDTGTLDVSCNDDDGDLVVSWTERGGPHPTDAAREEGYGSKLVRRSMDRQLGGSVDYDWQDDGVVVTLKMSKECLAS